MGLTITTKRDVLRLEEFTEEYNVVKDKRHIACFDVVAYLVIRELNAPDLTLRTLVEKTKLPYTLCRLIAKYNKALMENKFILPRVGTKKLEVVRKYVQEHPNIEIKDYLEVALALGITPAEAKSALITILAG